MAPPSVGEGKGGEEEGGAGPWVVQLVDEQQYQTSHAIGRPELPEETPLGEREGERWVVAEVVAMEWRFEALVERQPIHRAASCESSLGPNVVALIPERELLVERAEKSKEGTVSPRDKWRDTSRKLDIQPTRRRLQSSGRQVWNEQLKEREDRRRGWDTQLGRDRKQGIPSWRASEQKPWTPTLAGSRASSLSWRH